MAKITPEEARAYFARWDQLHEAEVAELRRTSVETKLRQLALLMASRHLFGPDPDRDRQIGEVRERWTQLRNASRG